jgi:hypothetical protein
MRAFAALGARRRLAATAPSAKSPPSRICGPPCAAADVSSRPTTKKKERCDLPKKRKVEASEKVELLQPPPAGPIGNDQTENRLFLLAMFPSFLGFSRQKPKMSCVGTDELRTKGEAVARAGRLPGRHETDT